MVFHCPPPLDGQHVHRLQKDCPAADRDPLQSRLTGETVFVIFTNMSILLKVI